MMLEVTDLKVSFGKMNVLHGVSLQVGEGELICVIGPNGAGKTTLLRTVMGLKTPDTGRIVFDGRDISNAPAYRRALMGIGYVPEGRRVFGGTTVEENLRVGGYVMKDEREKQRSIARVYELFPRLEERKGQLARTMSGGEQQMLAIGRALISSPKLLLIDEVSMGLMPLMVSACFRIIRELNGQGITVLVVEQNANKALKIADRGYVLETGEITVSDTAEHLRANDTVQKAYLGG